MKLFRFRSNLRRTMMLITGAFLLVTAGVVAVAGISRRYSAQGLQQTQTLTQQFLPGLVTLTRLQESTLKLNGIALQFTLAKDDASTAAQQEAFKTQSTAIQGYVASLRRQDASADTQARIDGFLGAVAAYLPLVEKLQAELKAGDFEKAMAILDKDVAAGQQALDAQLRALSEHFFRLSQGAGEATRASIEQSSRFSLFASIALAVVAVISLVATLVGGRVISRRLIQVAGTLHQGAVQVTSAATQVSSSSHALADGATQQAASLEETSASLEEMSGMTNRNAENANRANELTRQARSAADAGATDMQAMTAAMTDIKTSSDDIAKIIKTIDEIAFQTNILALNAAVEAARAGEAGMGFAVVADEVRALAQRSAQAARETADKIEGAITKTGQGVQISGKVAAGLTEIVDKVRQVDQLVAEVSTASREQSQGVKQITAAVTNMDRVVQGNAASAEQSASAAEEMKSQSRSLQDAIDELLELAGARGSEKAANESRDSSSVGEASKASRPRAVKGRNVHAPGANGSTSGRVALEEEMDLNGHGDSAESEVHESRSNRF